MPKYNIVHIIMLIFTVSVCIVLVGSVIGMVVSGKTTADNVAIRTAMIDMIKYIVGGIFGSLVTIKSQAKE